MSRIDRMIAEMCPDGVEHRRLGEVGTFIRGNGLQKKDFVDDGEPCIHYGQVHTRFGISTDRTVASVPAEQWNKLRHAVPGDLLIATTSEDDDAVGKATVWLGDGETAIGGDMYIFRHDLDPKYVSYFFASRSFMDQKRPFISGTKVRRLSEFGLEKIVIPTPPIEIQREIVRVLDQFTELEAELEAELEERTVQFRFYRSELLRSHDTATLMKASRAARSLRVGDVSTLRRGQALTASQATPGPYPVVANGPLPVYSHDKANRSGETIVVARSGANAGLVSFWDGEFFLTDAFSFTPDPEVVEGRYLFHALSAVQARLSRLKLGAGVPHVRASELAESVIPVPSLENQRHVAGILDRLESMVTDMNHGIPAEIAARRQQYEYYRDKLLTFPEKKTA